MNKIPLKYFFIFLSLNMLNAQNLDQYISIDQTTYTVDQLVQDVLINNQCASITNIVSSTGTDFGSTNGIGYFSGNGISFPFTEGIILSTGNATESAGPETGSISAGDINWLGDADLANAVSGHDLASSYNATYIQFDFIPLSNLISFNFIFASDEYGYYQCEYTDAFAFLLTDNVTGVTTNLALVPGTSDPISVLSVRDETHNGYCPSVNDDFFEAYYGSTGLPEIESPTNYRGHTVSMAAVSTVFINRSYSIKLVIADALDPLLDAAVFLEGDSFNLGQDLLEDITVCENDSIQFEAPFIEDAIYTWSGPAGFISSIQNPMIDDVSSLNQGEYFLEILINNECAFTSSMFVTTSPGPETVLMTPLSKCDDDTDGFTAFTLTDKDSEALMGQTAVTVSYHETEQGALDNTAGLGSTYSNTDQNTEQIWIRLTNDTTQCYSVMSMDLIVSPLPIPVPTFIGSLCDDDTDGLQTFDMIGVASQVIGSQTDMEVSYHATEQEAADNVAALGTSITTTNPHVQTLWIRLENTLSNCYALSTIDLVVDPLPTIETLSLYVLCDDTNTGDLEEIFDLRTMDSTVTGIQTGVVVSYHVTAQQAQDNLNPLPMFFPSTTQTIYVALETTATGCRAVAPLDLVVDPVPEDFSALEINICNYLNVGDVLVDYPNIVIYNSADSIEALNPTTPLFPGVYYIAQLNDFNCKSVNLVNVYMSCLPIIPDAFSPNSDGFNDYFNIQNLYDVYKEHKLKIFNRFGVLVFEGNNSKKWDGYVDNYNEIVPVGTYFYMLELNNTNIDIYTGWVYVNY